MRKFIGLAALGLALLVPVQAHAYTPAVVVQDENRITCGNSETRANAFARARWLRAKYIRIQAFQPGYVPWGGTPCDPVNAARAIHAAGFSPQITIMSDARYAEQLARQVGPIVRIWGVWNEPNHRSWWRKGITSNPKSYIPVFRRLSAAIRKGDRSSIVLAGETAPELTKTPGTYLIRATRAGSIRPDGIAIHTYLKREQPSRLSSYLRAQRASNRTLAKKRLVCSPKSCRNPLPIYITEYGYNRRGYWALPDTTIAARIPVTWKIACQGGVRQISQYQLYGDNGTWDTSVFTADGTPRLQGNALASYVQNTRRCTQSGRGIDSIR